MGCPKLRYLAALAKWAARIPLSTSIIYGSIAGVSEVVGAFSWRRASVPYAFVMFNSCACPSMHRAGYNGLISSSSQTEIGALWAAVVESRPAVYKHGSVTPKRGERMPTQGPGFSYPKDFRTKKIITNGTRLHVRIGDAGPAVVLIHGYGETGDMWVPLAKELARDHTVVIPDLRGMGLSAIPHSGYDKKTQARDIAGVLDALKIDRAALVTHDIGNMVGYAFAASPPAPAFADCSCRGPRRLLLHPTSNL